MPVDKALSIMAEMAGTAIDSRCFQALKQALRRVDPAMAA
jgi:HD-GYP domain-containing protein (c-di-GMP phosphodiesterase class II)